MVYVPSRAALATADINWYGDVANVTPEWELDGLPPAVRTEILVWEIHRTFNGTGADDVLAFGDTGPLPFLIVGLAGNDIILDRGYDLRFPSNSGHEVHVLGGPGNDWIDGAEGDDVLAGGSGDDTLYGGPGSNHLLGGGGSDLLDASIGTWHGLWWHADMAPGGPAAWAEAEAWRSDTLEGGGGSDVLIGSRGDDLLDGGAGWGDDHLRGQDGDDTLIGGQDADTMLGENHDDRLDGGSGYDMLQGGNGDDVLDGGAHRDTLAGGNGTDALLGGDDKDRISGGRGGDWIRAGSGDDTVDGGAGDDIVLLGSGDDFMLARDAHGGGDDRIEGGAGDDRIHGGFNEDHILGDAGNDTLNGGAGNDTLTGGAGADTFEIRGLYGRETITDLSFDDGDRILLQEGIYGTTGDTIRSLIARTYEAGDNIVIPLSTDGANVLVIENHGGSQVLGIFEHIAFL